MRLKAQHSAIKSGALPFSSDKVKKMEQIFNAFIGMLFLFILTFGGISYYNSGDSSKNAEEYVAEAAQIIESSNYADDVINDLKDKAAASGYGFTVNSVDLDGDVAADMAEVFLDYKYQCLL